MSRASPLYPAELCQVESSLEPKRSFDNTLCSSYSQPKPVLLWNIILGVCSSRNKNINNPSVIFQFFIPFTSFLTYFSFFDMQIIHMTWYMGNDILENVIYLCYYKNKSLRGNHVRVFLPWYQTCTFLSVFVS